VSTKGIYSEAVWCDNFTVSSSFGFVRIKDLKLIEGYLIVALQLPKRLSLLRFAKVPQDRVAPSYGLSVGINWLTQANSP